ncbi:MAG TPA: response regulator [Acidobacteriota bacterium]|nr:response regulator [Acidobacteriota bacterium]
MARILVIDDESDIRMATIMALQTGGHTIVEADSGIAAMKLLKDQLRSNTVVDLIVCDVMMPGMTGHDVCQLVRLDPALSEIPFTRV